MKKYYIVHYDKEIETAELLGNFENIHQAKEKALNKMGDGDLLIGFESDVDAEIIDENGCRTVDSSKADSKEKAFLYKAEQDDYIEYIKDDLWYWDDEIGKNIYHNRDGSIWESNMNVYLYCASSTFAGVVLAENKDEAKAKISRRYNASMNIIVIDPLDRDIILDDVYEFNDLFSYTSLKEQEVINENEIMKEELKKLFVKIRNFLK
jgi:hypothetical protein